MTALVTAVLAVAARIIARIAFAAGSREKPAPAATAAPAHPAFSSAAVAGSRPAVTRTGVARIAVRPGPARGPGPGRCAAAPATGLPAGLSRAAIALPPGPATSNGPAFLRRHRQPADPGTPARGLRIPPHRSHARSCRLQGQVSCKLHSKTSVS